MSLNDLILAASEHGEPAIHPYVVGGGVLAVLLLALGLLVAFGGGREHS